MADPVPTPGEKPPRLWPIYLLSLTAAALFGAICFLLLEARPPSGGSDPRFWPLDGVFLATLPLAKRFDLPMGSEHGALVYNAQPFTENQHLGDDLNGIGGENTDLGDPVYSIATGRVIYTGWPAKGWGNLILVMHAYEENGRRRYVQACYAHLKTVEVQIGEEIQRGQKIGSVGNAGGLYLAHLHFELREFRTAFVGSGYRADTRGWLDPSRFLQDHRGAADWDLRRESSH